MSNHGFDNSQILAHAVAPEDIRPGDFVAVLAEVEEYLPVGALLECSALTQPRSLDPVRVQWLPCGESMPLKVEAVCLPWVVVKAPHSPTLVAIFGLPRFPTALRTLDVRRYRLARLPEEYGKRVYRMLKERVAKRRAASAGNACDEL